MNIHKKARDDVIAIVNFDKVINKRTKANKDLLKLVQEIREQEYKLAQLYRDYGTPATTNTTTTSSSDSTGPS